MTEPTKQEPSAGDSRSDRLDLPIAILLGVVAIVTAFATYLAVLEDGETLQGFNDGVRFTDLASQKINEGNQQLVQDQALFLEYAKASRTDDDDLTTYLRGTLFRPELEEGVAWWEEQEEALTPFEEGSPYTIAAFTEGEELDAQAEAAFGEAQQHDEDGDKYVLATVVLSIALFLLGVAGVRRRYRIQLAMITFASLITVAAAVQIVAVLA